MQCSYVEIQGGDVMFICGNTRRRCNVHMLKYKAITSIAKVKFELKFESQGNRSFFEDRKMKIMANVFKNPANIYLLKA